ncbi:hypothetical protein [Dickeya zeae]
MGKQPEDIWPLRFRI